MKAIVLILIISFILQLNCIRNVSSQSKLTSEENNVVYASTNSKFNINLAGNPTTGYEWYLKIDDDYKKSEDYIKLINFEKNSNNSGILSTKNYKSDSNEEGLAGVGGVFTFEFKSSKNEVENLVLNFVYMRSWDSNDGPSNIKVKINLKNQNNNQKKEQGKK